MVTLRPLSQTKTDVHKSGKEIHVSVIKIKESASRCSQDYAMIWHVKVDNQGRHELAR